MPDRGLTTSSAEPTAPTGPVLRLDRVTRRYRGRAGVREVSLSVGPGEIHALVGLNGAGKSTLLKLAVGMLRPQSGLVVVDSDSDADAARHGHIGHIGHLIENPFAYRELTTRANLALSARLHGIRRPEIAGVVDGALTEFGLARYAAVPARQLSLGNKQKLGLASALQHHPRLVVLDEPTNSLDPRAVILLREVLRRRARRHRAAVLVSSHHLDEVARIADRVSVINHGHIVGALDPTGTDIERSFFTMIYRDDAATGEDRE